MTTPLLLDILLKGAAVLALATLALLCMRRATAAARHLLWTSALVTALIIPLASVTLPAWRVLPQWMDSQAVATVNQETKQVTSPSSAITEKSVSPPVAEALPVSHPPNPVPAAPGISEPFVAQPVAPSPPPTTIPSLVGPTEPTDSDSTSATVFPDTPSAPTHSKAPFPWVTIWLVGVLLMLAPLALSALSLFRLERRSHRVTTGTLAQIVSRLSQELGLRRRVRLLLGPDDAMPMVWGLTQYRLMLPRKAVTWSEETLRTVLLHELAHLKRHDPLTLLLSHLSVALHWPNPFVWLALRGVRIECEQAADDAVLRSGVRPSDYATDMLSLSEQCRPLLLKGAAMSMARPSTVTKRISAVLERGRDRRQLAIRVCVLTTLTAFLLALPLAMLQAVTIAPGEEGAEVPEVSFEEKTKAYLELQKEPSSKERSERLIKDRRELIRQYDPEKVLKFADGLALHPATPFISEAMAKIAREEESDLNALVERVNAMKIITHREASAFSVVRAVAERDPSAAVALIPKLMLRSEVRQATEAVVYEDLIVRDPSTAATFIAMRPRTRITDVALQAVASYWGARDLPGCLNWSRSLPPFEDRRLTRQAAIHACARKRPQEIVPLLQKFKEEGRSQSAWLATPAELRGPILNTAHRTLLEVNPEGVDAWIASLPKDGSVPNNWLKLIPPSALPTIEDALKLPEGSSKREEIIHQRLTAIARKDPKRALELSLQLPIKRRSDVAHSAAQALIKTDLDAAVAFFDKHLAEFAVTNGNAFVDTYFALAGRDLAGAERVLALANDPRCKIPAGRLREIALGALIQFDSPQRAFEEASKIGGLHVHGVCSNWLRYDRTGFLAWMKLAPENKVLGLVALIHQTAEQAPMKAAEYISELDPLGHEDPSHHWRWEVSKIFQQLLQRDEKYALKWAKNLQSRDFALPAWFGVATHLARSDPKAAAEWITNLPAGLGRKAAAHGFFSALVNERISGHHFIIGSTAFRVDTFGKDKEKEAAGILARMKPEHHDAARLVLKALELDEDTHQRLLKSFAK